VWNGRGRNRAVAGRTASSDSEISSQSVWVFWARPPQEAALIFWRRGSRLKQPELYGDRASSRRALKDTRLNHSKTGANKITDGVGSRACSGRIRYRDYSSKAEPSRSRELQGLSACVRHQIGCPAR